LLRIFAGTIVLEEQVKKSHQDALEFIKKLELARDKYENLCNLSENKTIDNIIFNRNLD
jgi:hypothetical protein|tara:strand:+ start:179 stop:355 length:177 start_codon:yes stop_codon:yes gene_type:complete